MFKILDYNYDKKLSEADLFQLMRLTSSTNEEQQEGDLFLEIFSNDFVKVTKSIGLKRRVRGREDPYHSKIKAIELKL